MSNRLLTNEELDKLKYYYFQKGDMTRYEFYTELVPELFDKCPELMGLMRKMEMSKLAFESYFRRLHLEDEEEFDDLF